MARMQIGKYLLGEIGQAVTSKTEFHRVGDLLMRLDIQDHLEDIIVTWRNLLASTVTLKVLAEEAERDYHALVLNSLREYEEENRARIQKKLQELEETVQRLGALVRRH